MIGAKAMVAKAFNDEMETVGQCVVLLITEAKGCDLVGDFD